MIAQLRGKIAIKSTTEAVIDCCGVGYLVFISLQTAETLPEVGQEVVINTLMITREDSMSLYGFATVIERELFKLLTTVSGIGPKSAIGILSSVSNDELRRYILESNAGALQKFPGVGKKTAERLIVELKDKMLKINLGTSSSNEMLADNLVKQEVISALLTLGFNKAKAESALKKACSELDIKDQSAEKLLKIALRFAMD